MRVDLETTLDGQIKVKFKVLLYLINCFISVLLYSDLMSLTFKGQTFEKGKDIALFSFSLHGQGQIQCHDWKGTENF